MSSKLDAIAQRLADYIAADPALQAHDGMPAIVPILEKKGDIASAVTTALSSLGLAVIVIVADCRPLDRQRREKVCQARLVVEVCETVATNKSGRNCLEVAERVWAACDRKSTEQRADFDVPVRSIFELEDESNLRLVPHATKTIRHITFTAETVL